MKKYKDGSVKMTAVEYAEMLAEHAQTISTLNEKHRFEVDIISSKHFDKSVKMIKFMEGLKWYQFRSKRMTKGW